MAAAIAWENLFDSATLSAFTSPVLTPVSNMQNEHVGSKWASGSATTDWMLATFDDFQSADTFMIAGLASDFTAAGTVRLRLSSASATGGDIWDTTVQAGIVDPDYGYAIHLAPVVKSGFKFARWDFQMLGAENIKAGRGFIGTRSEFIYNYAPGARRSWTDLSTKTRSAGGQTFIDRAVPGKFRTYEFDLGWIPEAQRWAVHEAIDVANGTHTDVLYINDVDSSNLGRDCVWGLISELSPVIQLEIVDLYSRSYRIEERL